jgi:hypothetical protein
MVQFESSALVLAGFFRMLDSNPSYPYISLVIVEPRKAPMKVAIRPDGLYLIGRPAC